MPGQTADDTTPKRGFDRAEFEQRLARAQRILEMSKLDAVFVTTPPNIRYFTGFDSQFFESPTRPWFVVVPATGEPIAVIPEIAGPKMAETLISDIRTWPAPRPSDDGVSLLASVLSSVPRHHGRIGAELGREMSLRMPIIEFEALRGGLLGLHIVNGSPAIWSMRKVKTEAEIGHIRHICQIASRVYDRVPDLVQIGDSEREAARKVRIDLSAQGADATPFLPAISGPGGVPQIVCGPGDRTLVPGDVLFFDTGSTFDGYFCDFDRNYAIGAISDEAKRAQDLVWSATEVALKALRPGMTTDMLFDVMAEALSTAGPAPNNVGRLGHGLGLQLTEPPSHMVGDGTIIEENMVLTIEPGLEYAPGKMIVHEENVVVRSDGVELLTSRSPREMPIIG